MREFDPTMAEFRQRLDQGKPKMVARIALGGKRFISLNANDLKLDSQSHQDA